MMCMTNPAAARSGRQGGLRGLRSVGLAIAVAGVLGLASGAASAASLVTPLIGVGPFNTDVSGGLINLPLFDSNLGTLTSVTISESGTFSGSALLTNNGHMPDSFSLHIAGQAGVDLLSSDPSAAANDLKATVFDLALTTQSYNLPKSGSAQYGAYSTGWGAAISGLPVADFQQAGGGTVPIHVDVTSYPSDTPGVIELNDVFYAEESVLGTAALQARYEYIPATVGAAPEPAGWAMMLMGVGAMGASLRSRRRLRAFAAG
jgi:hypothetical protein